MTRAMALSVVLLGTLAATTSCGRQPSRQLTPSAASPKRISLRFATGPLGGAGYRFGVELAHALDQIPGVAHIDVVQSAGSVANLSAVHRGDVDVALTFADVTYLAFVGRMEDRAFDDLRAISVLQLTPVQLIARDGAGIRTVNDLRGRHVSVGPRGTGTPVTARLILKAFGMAPSDLWIEELPFPVSGDRLVHGTLDAMFSNPIQPTDAAARTLPAGSSLVPISGPLVDHLRTEYPFFRLAALPRDMRVSPRKIPTLGVNTLLICRRDLDEMVVHDLIARLFPALSSLSVSRNLTFAELDEAPATPIPLHSGALRYYREQEMLQ